MITLFNKPVTGPVQAGPEVIAKSKNKIIKENNRKTKEHVFFTLLFSKVFQFSALSTFFTGFIARFGEEAIRKRLLNNIICSMAWASGCNIQRRQRHTRGCCNLIDGTTEM